MANSQQTKRGSRLGRGNISLERKAEMVAALPLMHGCQSAVAREFGVGHNVVNRALRSPEVAKLAQAKKAELAEGFGRLTTKLLARYEEIAEQADMSNKGSTVLGIAADKFLLYTGEANQIVQQVADPHADAQRERVAGILESLTAALGSHDAAMRRAWELAPDAMAAAGMPVIEAEVIEAEAAEA